MAFLVQAFEEISKLKHKVVSSYLSYKSRSNSGSHTHAKAKIILTGGGALYPLIKQRVEREIHRSMYMCIKDTQIEILGAP